MFKKEEGITLAMLTLTVAILLMIAFATVLIVFDSGFFSDNNVNDITKNTNIEIVNNEESDTQEINRTEATNTVR